MRKRRFNEEQIVAVLKEADAGVSIGELCRRLGVSEGTFYRWKTKYGGLAWIIHDFASEKRKGALKD